ncbi:GNAT family N-acetyltransferase [Williamsia sp. R60]
MSVEIRHTWELSALQRHHLRELFDRAFDGEFADTDYDHALGGLHVTVASDGGDVVAHAAVVARSMVVDEEPLRVGYVEAVAVDPTRQRQGLGHQVMEACERIVLDAYDFGALSASAAGEALYRARGWRPWEGELGAMTPDGSITTPDDRGGVHVFGEIGRSDGRLLCDWRSGDLW